MRGSASTARAIETLWRCPPGELHAALADNRVIAFRKARHELAVYSGQTAVWHFVPPDAAAITMLEWRKVLDSPYREAIRREIPPESAPLLGSINFIEGIERVVLAASVGQAAERARGHDLWVSAARWTEGTEAFEFGLAITLGRFDIEQLIIGMLGDRGGLEQLPRTVLALERGMCRHFSCKRWRAKSLRCAQVQSDLP